MESTVAAAKAEFVRAKDRLTKALATTPDDKINWSPAPPARTPVHQVAHAAISITGMQDWLAGKPFPYKDMAEMDAASRAKEKEFSTREEVLGILEKNSKTYLAWLDGLSSEKLASNLETGMGSFPMTSAITFPADHLRAHASQIEYIQTCYGDMDWHF